ncbi:7063_t:CDS:2 [Funneliformis geosporum]|nr:7063_t:CDS:2 [Funneliformis geosporum]
MEQARVQEYSSYQQVYQRKEQEQKERFQQLQLLRNYQGCKQCGSLAVDAYSLYEENRLVCQPCRLVKESKASEAISFKCADKWKESKEHLNNCDCLKVEAKELYLLKSAGHHGPVKKRTCPLYEEQNLIGTGKLKGYNLLLEKESQEVITALLLTLV